MIQSYLGNVYIPGTTLEGGGAEGALAPPEIQGSEKRTERETDNLAPLPPLQNLGKSAGSFCQTK